MVSLSVIIPFRNEKTNLPKLHEGLVGVLKHLPVSSEVVYINDGSDDDSEETLTLDEFIFSRPKSIL